MGILNRLIGDQKRLYQSRKQSNYFFRDIESLITFKDFPSCINHEMVYIRNITGSTDQNSYTGMIKVSDPIFSSEYSNEFWGVLGLEVEELCGFIINANTIIDQKIEKDPLSIMGKLEYLNKQKSLEKEGKIHAAHSLLAQTFKKFKGLNSKGQVLPVSLYCSALYLQLDRLSGRYDMSTAMTKAGGISGISNNGFTKKDFMSQYTTGAKKRIWGNPYLREEFIKGEGKSRNLLKKASGKLEIEIAIERNHARSLISLIENAGVSSFYFGKKGLAYVSRIRP
jgi:hypothetical protein